MSFNLKFKSMTKQLLLSIFIGVVFVSSVAAQDTLPRDNGIFSAHKSPRYRESESHPLRIVAYALHPVGWVLREAIFRPFSAFAGSTEVTRSVMGFREPFDFREPHCFSSDDTVPDCKSIAPMNALSSGPEGLVSGAEGESEPAKATESKIYFPDINFDFNKSTLNDLGKGRVQQMASLLKTTPNVKVVVEGHTDFKGTDEYNNKLGEARANAVLAELKTMGVNTELLTPMSYGESKPLVTEESDWARAVNRRVQFTLGEVVNPEVVKTSLPEAKIQ